jgi:hypothetical protein
MERGGITGYAGYFRSLRRRATRCLPQTPAGEALGGGGAAADGILRAVSDQVYADKPVRGVLTVPSGVR